MGMKSHFFAEMLIERCLLDTTRAVCIREVQKSIKQSVKLLLEDKIKALGVEHLFDVLEAEIRHKENGSLIIFMGMANHTADSIKSLENFDIAWWEEAQTASQRSLELLIPTIIRKVTAELWFSWNPETEDQPIETLLRSDKAVKGAVLVFTSYKDNPYLAPEIVREIEAERLRDPDKFAHIWLGQYRRTLDGAVYAKELRDAYESGRVTRVLPIPNKPIETFWDLGKRDHTAIWFAQLNLGEYRILDFYQNRGENLPHYFNVIRERGYQLSTIWLPHDAEQDRLTGSIDRVFRTQYPNNSVRVIKRMKTKATGIEAVRRIFPNCVFDEEKCREGLKSLARFKYDVDPDTGGYSQNPLHDEYSDGADAFAQLALSLQEAKKPTNVDFRIGNASHSWMG
jgi:phage terminase large subunit